MDKIVDVYYVAENNTMRLSQELPIEIDNVIIENTYRWPQPSKISTASINNSDLILEDWLNRYIFELRDNNK